MKKISKKEAILLLRKYANNEKAFKGVLRHSKAVKKVAVDIGKRVKGIDLQFVKSASLLHDIGRFQCGPESEDNVKHGIVGADILRKENLPEHALVAERHLGAGISKEDILEQGLELPLKDYIPVSKEEKIICHADNLIEEDKRISLKKVVERFEKELGKKVGKRVKELAEEVEAFKNQKK